MDTWPFVLRGFAIAILYVFGPTLPRLDLRVHTQQKRSTLAPSVRHRRCPGSPPLDSLRRLPPTIGDSFLQSWLKFPLIFGICSFVGKRSTGDPVLPSFPHPQCIGCQSFLTWRAPHLLGGMVSSSAASLGFFQPRNPPSLSTIMISMLFLSDGKEGGGMASQQLCHHSAPKAIRGSSRKAATSFFPLYHLHLSTCLMSTAREKCEPKSGRSFTVFPR